MIVRTAPVILPQPDAMRAMERLESQLRRAADDLRDELAMMRDYAAVPLFEVPEPHNPYGKERCGRWMPNAKTWCYRFEGHGRNRGGPACRSRETMEGDSDRRRIKRHAA